MEVIKVKSFVDTRPMDLEKFQLRRLQDECDRWNLRVSGNRSEVLARLESFFQGEPITRKGCTKKFVKLEQDELVTPKAQAKSRSQAASSAGLLDFESPTGRQRERNPEAQHGTADPSSFREDRSNQKDFDEDSRFFRSSVQHQQRGYGSSATPEQYMPKAKDVKQEKPPLSRLPTENGEHLPGIHCRSCGSDLVLRQNRNTGNRFFGCIKFGKTNCRFTMDYDDGIAAASSRALCARLP